MIYSLLDLYKKNAGRVVIVGSGPTNLDYGVFRHIKDGVVIWMNDMVKYAEHCPCPDQLFVSHHLSKYKHQIPQHVTTVYLQNRDIEVGDWSGRLRNRVELTTPRFLVDTVGHNIITQDWMDQHEWLARSVEVVHGLTLMMFHGTITTALHLAFLAGPCTLELIGCNPHTTKDDHDIRIGGRMLYEPDKVRLNQINIMKWLDLQPRYLGD